MQVINSVKELQSTLNDYKNQNKTIGFIPTMGALHNGHISLVNRAEKENDVVVVSIFVNPTQFNDKNDLKNYPRDLNADLQKLSGQRVDFVFAPSVEEMYPETDTRKFDFGNLEHVMEGARRPGHFNGVAQIVSKLFEIVGPTKAYFGEKDFQQLTIINQLVRVLNLQVQIVPCPIIRENDGLAMSSRNVLLTPVQRISAATISQVLFKSQQMAAQGEDVAKIKLWVESNINSNPELVTEYFEIVDDEELMPVKSWKDPKGKVGCVAVKVGNIRLIDNVRYNQI